MNILDFVLIAIIVGCVVNGYFKGFFKELFDIVGFVLGVVLFRILYPLINNLFLGSSFFTKVKEWATYDLGLSTFVADTPEKIIDGINSLNLPDMIKNLLLENNTQEFFNAFNATNVADYIAGIVAIVVVSLITLFVVLILVSIIVSILARTTNFLSRMPALGSFDKIGGIALGVVNGIFTVWLIGIILLILSVFPPLAFLKDQFDGFLTEILINNNFLLKFLLNMVVGIIN